MSWWSDNKEVFSHILDLREGLDRKGTIDKIHKNIEVKGANVWLLICSIFIASIGLDQDSQAVIIGAMLISPLMSPILGIGLSIGINDRKTLWESARHFLIAIAVSLITSTIYFLITPFGNFNGQIEARTIPTILDVMVAFFGGIAGVVAITRKDLINAVPGVAIATALLPPLCVTGFGLANVILALVYGTGETGRYLEIMGGSFYLFFLNSTFVSLATYLIVRFLRFPYKTFVNPKEKKRNATVIALVAILLIIPAFYILVGVLQNIQRDSNVKNFIGEINRIYEDDCQVMNFEFIETDSSNHIHLYLVGKYLQEDSIKAIESRMSKYMLQDCILDVDQLGEPPQEYDKMIDENRENLAKTVQMVQQIGEKKETEINQLQAIINKLKSDSIPHYSLQSELAERYPDLKKFSIARLPEATFGNQIDTIPVVLLEWDSKLKSAKRQEQEANLKAFLEGRLALKGLKVIQTN